MDDGGADTMISTVDATALINELFEEEALVIGGLVAVHEMDDDLVWRLIQNFNVIRGQILRRSRPSSLCLNPAIHAATGSSSKR